MAQKCFDSLIILRFYKTKVGTKEFYDAKKLTKIWDVNVDYVVISKSGETKNKSKYQIGYLNEVIRALALMLPKMSGYVKKLKYKGGDKNSNTKLMALHIDDDKLLKNAKPFGRRLKTFKNLHQGLCQFLMIDSLPIYDKK